MSTGSRDTVLILGAMVTRESPVPLYLQVEDEIRSRISSGELAVHARVPSEAEIAERYGVSRITAQKALDRLVAEGLLFRQPGKGTFVARPKIPHEPSQALSFSRAMAQLGLRCETRVLAAGMTPAPPHVASVLGTRSGSPLVFVRRLRLVEDRPSAAHASYLPARFAKVLDADLTGSLIAAMQAAGASIAIEQDSVEARVATADDAALLELDVGAPLLAVRGMALGHDGAPVRYSETIYPGELWRFSVETTANAEFQPAPTWVRPATERAGAGRSR
jgi:GntR family transcriptional regulator